MLPLRGLQVKHALQLGNWIPTQHLLWDQRKTMEKPSRSWPVAGPFGCKLTSSQQFGIKYANHNIVPIFVVALLKKVDNLFLQIFYVHIIWINTKPCITPAEGMEGMSAYNVYTNMHISVFVIR
jgi:hypothetical protein